MLPIHTANTREVRQEFKTRVDEIIAHKHLLAIERGHDNIVSYVIPADLGELLRRLPDIDDVENFRDWLRQLYGIRIADVGVLQPALLAHLEASKEHRRDNAVSLAAMEQSLPASRDGRTVALQFAQPGLVRHGLLTLLEDGEGFHLQGSFEVEDPDRRFWLELADGQVVDNLEVTDGTYRVPRTKVADDIDLLFTWLVFEPRRRRASEDGGGPR